MITMEVLWEPIDNFRCEGNANCRVNSICPKEENLLQEYKIRLSEFSKFPHFNRISERREIFSKQCSSV